MPTRLFTFAGGATGPWRTVHTEAIIGEPLAPAARLDILPAPVPPQLPGATWLLHGIVSNERYVMRSEKTQLVAKQQDLGRPEAVRAALIPLRKNAAWWTLTQDERRQVFEEQSRHIQIGLHYLPAIARRLHHCRDLGESEPFDFLTWFEYAPEHETAFNALLAELRASPEWRYVDREMEIRLVREPA